MVIESLQITIESWSYSVDTKNKRLEIKVQVDGDVFYSTGTIFPDEFESVFDRLMGEDKDCIEELIKKHNDKKVLLENP